MQAPMQVSGAASVLDKGCACGVIFDFHNGLLDLELQPHQVLDIVEFLRSQIKAIVRTEKFTPTGFVQVHRMSRMCFELATERRISNLDRLDVDLIYEVPQDAKFEWVFKIFNELRDRVRRTECSIVVADHVAKNIEEIMTS